MGSQGLATLDMPGDDRETVALDAKKDAEKGAFSVRRLTLTDFRCYKRQRIEADYRSRKRQELTERLFHDLMSRYDVRIKPIEETAHTDPPTRSAKEKSSSKQSDEEDPE